MDGRSSKTSGSGINKRAFQRHEINLPVRCCTRENFCAEYVARNFCLGGMYITYDPLQGSSEPPLRLNPGDIIQLQVRLSDGVEVSQMLARVVRFEDDSFGVAFVNPDARSLEQIVHYLKEEFASKAASQRNQAKPVTTASHEELIDYVRSAASQFVEPLLQRLYPRFEQELFERAGESLRVADLNAYFETIELLKKKQKEFSSAFAKEANKNVNSSPGQLALESVLDSGEALDSGFSLVEEDAIDDWIALSDIAHKVESANHEALLGIEQRLSILFATRVDLRNNPIGPNTFARAFQAAVKGLHLRKKAYIVCCRVFRDVMVDEASALYDQVNQYLGANGILPEFRYVMKRYGPSAPKEPLVNESTTVVQRRGIRSEEVNESVSKEEQKPAAAPTRAATESTKAKATPKESEPSAPTQTVTEPTRPRSASKENEPSAPTQTVAESAKAKSTSKVTEQPAPTQTATETTKPTSTPKQGVVVPEKTKPAPSPVAAQVPAERTRAPAEGEDAASAQNAELSQLLNSLVMMRRAQHTDQAPKSKSKKSRLVYRKDDLLKEIAKLSVAESASNATSTAAPPESYALKWLQELESAGDHKLGDREASIIETTGSIYSALFVDKMINPTVKRWLSKMELPLLDHALRDERVLSDQSHIVRRFINRLAQLEVYGDEKSDNVGDSVVRTIDGFLEKLSQQPGADEVILASLLKKVEGLVSVQNRAYAENVNEVIRRCAAGEAMPVLEVAQGEHALRVPTPEDEKDFPAWRARVRRLRIGNWIQVEDKKRRPKRVKLVWRDKPGRMYVFVNMMGMLEGALAQDELALLFGSGKATLIDGVEEAAFDRAQFKMLQSLYGNVLDESTHDPVTKVLNRREFERQLKQRLIHSDADAVSYAMCFFDLDYFDVVNQTFGYDAGDKVLAEAAARMNKVLAGKGLLARVGGDHFAALLERHTVAEATALVEQMRRVLAQYRYTQGDKKVAITFSAGIVRVDPKQADATRLLQTAEAACLLAKNKGVNSLHVIESGEARSAKSKDILNWALNIDSSLNSDVLQLRYQIISPLVDKTLPSHAEILLSVRDAQGALISPEHFILAAERYRRMPEVDRWVVGTVFDLINRQPEKMKKLGGLAINLSGLSINDSSFLGFIMDRLKTLKMPPSFICFEITETAGIESLSDAAEFITEVKNKGCAFSLDDFGTGMASYSYLKKLPVDYLKIDGSFVRDMEKSENDAAVVKSITEIGHFMGKKIIAEWVENERLLTLLRDLGVDYGQGFAIKRPVFFR